MNSGSSQAQDSVNKNKRFDCPDSEASRARSFVLRSQELQILSFNWESDILILSTNFKPVINTVYLPISFFPPFSGGPPKKVGDEAVHKELGDRMERAATTASSLEAEQDSGMLCFGITKDGVRGITATIDRKGKVFVSEASTRRHLKLEDSEGLKTLPTAEIFEQLALMGYVITSDSLTFQKGHFSPQWKFFIHTILHYLSPKKTAWEQFSSNIATDIIFLATNRTFDFSNLIFEAMRAFPTPTLIQKLFSNMKRASKGYSGVDIPLFPTMLTTPESSPFRITSSLSLSPQTHSSTSQPPSTPPSNQTTPVTEEAALMPHESPLQSVHLLGHDEGSLSLNELTDLYTYLSKKVESLESELKQTKQTYNAALTKLIKRLKKLEQTIKTSQARRRVKFLISDDEEAEEDPFNQGRSLIEELDLDAGISLVPPHDADQGRFDATPISDQPEEQLGDFSAATALADATRRSRSVENVQTYTRRRREVSIGSGGVSAASRLVSTVDISSANELDSTTGLKAKDKGKAIMHEFEPLKKIKKRIIITLQNRPFSVAEVRKNMCLYLKNQGGCKMSHFKGMGYEDIRPIFERDYGFDLKQESTQPIKEEIVHQDDVIAEQAVKESSRTTGGRRKKSLARKRARETLSKESAKKQKLEDDTEKEELQVYLNIVPKDESLDVK
ncbi:hypothetical protein Tco_1368877 [Tanacetum coccineum]